MKTKHTPGPWVAPNGTNEVHDGDGDLLFSPKHLMNQEDLNLIAAAPSLLFALENALEILLDRVHDPMGHHKSGTILLVKDAITKAKGGAR